jgi:hypothetical protein
VGGANIDDDGLGFNCLGLNCPGLDGIYLDGDLFLRDWEKLVCKSDLDSQTLTMAPPGYKFDAELLADLYKSSGISRVKKNETKKRM